MILLISLLSLINAETDPWSTLSVSECHNGKMNLISSEDDEHIIKSPNYPQQYPQDIKCNYMIEAKEGHWIMIEIDDFSVDPTYDILEIEELVFFNNTKYRIPRAYLRGYLSDVDVSYSSASGSAFILRFNSQTGEEINFHYHLTIRRAKDTAETRSPCGDPLTFLDEVGDIIESNDQRQQESRCTKLLIAPKGKTIQFNALNSSASAQYFVSDLDQVRSNKRMPNCEEVYLSDDESSFTDYYESFSDEVIVEICPNQNRSYPGPGYEFTVTPKNQKCLCTVSSIKLNETHLNARHSSPHYQYGLCEGLNCSIEIENQLKNNETRYWSVYVDIKRKDYPTEVPAFALESPLFDSDENTQLFSLNSSSEVHAGFVITSPRFKVRTLEGAVQINFKLYPSPIECGCFRDAKQMFEIEDFSKLPGNSIELLIPKTCPPQDCWLRIKNKREKLLLIESNSMNPLNQGERLDLLLDGREKRTLYRHNEYGRDEFRSDEFGKEINESRFIYLHLKTIDRTGGKFEMTNISIKFKWENQCVCSDTKYTLTKDPLIITSPYYPENYCNNIICTYRLEAPEGAGINLDVLDMELISDDDVLYYYLTKDPRHNPTLYNGSSSIIKDNQVTIVFHTDASDTARGWKIRTSIYWENGEPGSKSHLWIFIFLIISAIFICGVYFKFRGKSIPSFQNPLFLASRLNPYNNNSSGLSYNDEPVENFAQIRAPSNYR